MNGKIPLTKNGFKDASTDPEVIRKWWAAHPNANIGIATGSGLAVIDVDVKNGAPGRESLRLLNLPPTLTVNTPSGGWHLYFSTSTPTRSRNAVLPGIDLKADGGYVVGAGSPGWAWADADHPITPLPANLTQSIPEGQRNTQLASIAGSLRRQGQDQDQILSTLRLENLRCHPPLSERELSTIAKSIASYPAGVHITLSDGQDPFPDERQEQLWTRMGLVIGAARVPVANLDNIMRVLEAWPSTLCHYDEFHKKIFHQDGHEWSEAGDTLGLQRFLQAKIGITRIGKDTVYDAVCSYAWKHRTNEPFDWMETLKWDGEPRIAGFFHTCLGAPDNPYTYSVSKNFWIGMAARIYRPGCQLDNMVVLEGGEGIGKTSTARIIGGEWYLRAHESVLKKDFFISLQGKLLVEIGELDAFRGAKVERIKSVIDTPSDNFRTPYDKTATDHPRMCIFMATTNEKEYIGDPAGGRRFWPVECGKIDLDLIRSERNQLFAEAVHCYKNGEKWYEVPKELAKQEQESRRMADAWQDLVHEHLKHLTEVRVIDVATLCLGIPKERVDRVVQKRISDMLRAEKWVNAVCWEEGRSVRKWIKC